MRGMIWTMGLVCLAGLVGCGAFDQGLMGPRSAASTVEKADLAQRGAPAAHVSGGGEAAFDEVPGLTSIFSVGANVYDDGSANGAFMCMIHDVVVIHGQVLTGTVNGDGSVTLEGVGDGIEFVAGEPVPFEDCGFEVTLWSGGPDVGRFLYRDCVATGDAETVIRGHIFIH